MTSRTVEESGQDWHQVLKPNASIVLGFQTDEKNYIGVSDNKLRHTYQYFASTVIS